MRCTRRQQPHPRVLGRGFAWLLSPVSFVVRPHYRSFFVAMSLYDRVTNMSLYDRVTKWGCFYVDTIERDVEQGQLTFNFLGNPDLPEIVRVLKFSGVQGFSEQREPRFTKELIQSIIGIEQYPGPTGNRYEIVLDEAVIEFISNEEPVVIDL